jgi:hypothetical protein
MRSTASAQEVSAQLADIANRLDVPASLYEEAQERYQAVCRWLAEDDTLLSYDPAMYAQGSFALGTVTRPPGDLHYDVDAVCVLHAPSNALTQKELKRLVGDRLKDHETYSKMLSPPAGGRRCWTIDYAESAQFHLDILPAIPDDQNTLIASGVSPDFAKHAILITDTYTWERGDAEWPRSNPKGYAEWFKLRMKVRLDELRKSAAAARHDASIESVPDYVVRTPLQQMVQLFKRHRDVAFGDDEDRPISIIITTLAAWAYSNEADLSEAISNAVPRMRRAINSSNGEYWVANPVNPHENFADKWKEQPRKAQLFHGWLDTLEREHESLLENTLVEKRADALDKSFGIRPASASTSSGRSRGLSLGLVPASQPTALRFDVPHREASPWPERSQYQVKLSAEATRKGFRKRSLKNGDVIGRNWAVDFAVISNAPMGARYYWQVVNTGREATLAHGLRGQLVKGDRTQHESTLYAGTHWVEVFVVHQGTCVARSGEFVVVIG